MAVGASRDTSIATGILDDETYDWAAVLELLERDRWPRDHGQRGRARARRTTRARRSTGIDVSPTGSAGLAGLDALRRDGVIGPDDTAAVLFTG